MKSYISLEERDMASGGREQGREGLLKLIITMLVC